MIKNNSGNTTIIVSAVVGVLVLGIGGYFGYNWYQDKLTKERISKLEKIQKAATETVKGFEVLDSPSESQTAESFLVEFKKRISTFKEVVEKLDKLDEKDKLDKDIQDEFKKCLDDSKGVLKNVELIGKLLEKRVNEPSKITQADTEDAEGAGRNVEEYDKLKSCQTLADETEDLIDELEK